MGDEQTWTLYVCENHCGYYSHDGRDEVRHSIDCGGARLPVEVVPEARVTALQEHQERVAAWLEKHGDDQSHAELARGIRSTLAGVLARHFDLPTQGARDGADR